jgi:adenylate cyclase
MTTTIPATLLYAISVARARKDDVALREVAATLEEMKTIEATAWAQVARSFEALIVGDLPRAMEAAEGARSTFQSTANRNGQVNALVAIGRTHDAMGDPGTALQQLQSALNIAEVLKDPHLTAVVATSMGNAYHNCGMYSDALKLHERALALHREGGDPADIANATTNLGLVLMQLGVWQTALEHYFKALAIHEEIGSRNSIARTVNNIGNAYYTIGNYTEALEYFDRARVDIEALGDRDTLAIIAMNIGNVYYSTGNYPAALEHYHRALSLQTAYGNRKNQARAIDCVGNVHFVNANITAALEHYQRALQIHEALGNRSGVADALGNIGGVYIEWKDYEQASQYLDRAFAMRRELGERNGMARVLSNIVGASIGSGQYEKAEQQLVEMDTIQIDDPNMAIEREIYRGLLQQHHGDHATARSTFHAALETARKHRLQAKQSDLHKLLRDLCQATNDFAGYIEHNNEYLRITEETNGKEATTKLAMQEKQRELDAKDRELRQHLAVLHSTLPKEVAERVARGEVVNDLYENATVIFLDIVGFTELSSSMSSQEVISLLDDVFSQCDVICAKYGVTKIKTIGDSYMCVSFDSVVNAARVALELVNIKSRIKNQESNQRMLQFRIGVHCGPVTAGVIGKERMQYDVWGDTVNVASRMESSGEPGKVHVSEAFALNLKSNTEHTIQNPIKESQNPESHAVSHEVSHEVSHAVSHEVQLVTIERGSIDIKGKGLMTTYWLTSTPS